MALSSNEFIFIEYKANINIMFQKIKYTFYNFTHPFDISFHTSSGILFSQKLTQEFEQKKRFWYVCLHKLVTGYFFYRLNKWNLLWIFSTHKWKIEELPVSRHAEIWGGFTVNKEWYTFLKCFVYFLLEFHHSWSVSMNFQDFLATFIYHNYFLVH